jgi:growth arrest-specific protein 8
LFTNVVLQLEDDLELRRKVDIHEIEERKNQHINDLMRNHEKAFRQMKNYYNDITNDNLKLIKSLKVRGPLLCLELWLPPLA